MRDKTGHLKNKSEVIGYRFKNSPRHHPRFLDGALLLRTPLVRAFVGFEGGLPWLFTSRGRLADEEAVAYSHRFMANKLVAVGHEVSSRLVPL